MIQELEYSMLKNRVDALGAVIKNNEEKQVCMFGMYIRK